MTTAPDALTIRSLAHDLSVHRNTASRYARAGMPRTSLAEAQAWLRKRDELAPARWFETRGCWSYFASEGWTASKRKTACRCEEPDVFQTRTPREKKHGARLVRARWARKNLVVCCARCGAVLRRIEPQRVPRGDLERVTRL